MNWYCRLKFIDIAFYLLAQLGRPDANGHMMSIPHLRDSWKCSVRNGIGGWVFFSCCSCLLLTSMGCGRTLGHKMQQAQQMPNAVTQGIVVSIIKWHADIIMTNKTQHKHCILRNEVPDPAINTESNEDKDCVQRWQQTPKTICVWGKICQQKTRINKISVGIQL